MRSVQTYDRSTGTGTEVMCHVRNYNTCTLTYAAIHHKNSSRALSQLEAKATKMFANEYRGQLPLKILIYLACYVCLCLSSNSSVTYKPCPYSSTPEIRELFVATCDTRDHWREFMAMKVWNITGRALREKGLSMVNVCKGRNWGKYGFLTKPLIYYDYIASLPKKSAKGGDVFVILMDSDTFWGTDSIEKIWNRFDCARKGKAVVVSTEMSCWIGRYCQQEDLNRFYPDISKTPSYSPFLNSGFVMGLASEVANMLNHVIVNNASYFIKYHKLKFDDQLAIADYSINVNPSMVALDYHQELAASLAVHAVGENPDTGWPFVCKNITDQLYPSCRDYTQFMGRRNYFKIDSNTCLAYKNINEQSHFYEELRTISPEPIIWHGNGAGKRAFAGVAHDSFLCFMNKLNWTETDHHNTFG